MADSGQIWAALIAAIGALAGVIITTQAGMLRRTERLTGIASSMRLSSEKQLVEDLRDDYVTTWALRQMAPVLPKRRFAAIVAYVAAVIVFMVWFISALATKYDPVTWWWYGATIAFALVGVICHATRFASRAKWAREERARRWMRRPFHSRLDDQLQ